MTRAMIAASVGALFASAAAFAQVGPPGEVINQGRVFRAITPSDTVDLALGPTRYLYNGGAAACAIAIIGADDSAAVTLSGVPGGAVLPVRVKRVMATGTVCTGIVGMW